MAETTDILPSLSQAETPATQEPIYQTKDGQTVTQTQLTASGYGQDRIDAGVKNGILKQVGDTQNPTQTFKTKDGQQVTTQQLLQSGYTQDRIDAGVHNGILSPSIEKKSPLGISSQNATPNTANGTQASTPSEQPLSSTPNNPDGLHPVSHVAVTPLALGRTPSPVVNHVQSSLVPKSNTPDKNNVDMSGIIVPDESAKQQGQKIEDAKELKGAGDAKNYLSDKLRQRNAPLTPTEHPIIPTLQANGQPLASHDPTDLNNYSLESIKKNVDLSNPTEQLAFDKYQKDRNLKEALKTSPNLDEAALTYESSQNPLMKAQVEKMQNGGAEIPNAYKGQAVADFLSQPDVIEKAKNDPEFKKQYNQTAFNLYANYPKYATRVVGQKISQEREDLGDNNGFANIPTQDGTDEMVNNMVKGGKLTSQEQTVYEKNIRPQLGVGQSIERGVGHILAPAFTSDSPIKTPDIATNFGESYQNTLKGAARSIEDVTNLSPINPLPTLTDAQRLTDKLNDNYSAVSINPVNTFHEATQSAGNLGGMILPMIMGGEIGKGLGASEKLANVVTNGLVFESQNKDNALQKFPDSPAKQLGYTVLGTALDATLAELLPTKEVGSAVNNAVKDDIGKVVNDFTDGNITADAAKKTVLDRVQKLVTKTVPDIAEKSAHTGGVMAGFSLLHNGLDRVFGGADTKNDDVVNDAVQAFKSGFLGSLPLSGLSNMGEQRQKITGQTIQQMANDPQGTADLINKSALVSPELAATKDERLSNLNEAVKVNAELNQTDLTDAQKQKFLLNHLAQKALESKAENTTTDVIKKDLLTKAKEHQNTKEAIYSGKDKAPEFEQSQPISSPINTIDNGKKTNDNAQTKGQEIENKGAAIPKEDAAPSIAFKELQDEYNGKVKSLKDNGATDDEANKSDKESATALFHQNNEGLNINDASKKAKETIKDEPDFNPFEQKETANKKEAPLSKDIQPTENPVSNDTENKEPKKIGVSHASLTELAKKLGLKEPERGTRLTNEQQADRGRQLLNAGADIEQLEKEFKDGKQPTADDVSVARAHVEDLEKISDAMRKKWGVDSKQYDNANKELERFDNEVMKPMGSKTSDPFAALQGERDVDTGSFISVRKAVEKNKGSEATKEQLAKIESLTKENEDLKQKNKEAEAKLILQTENDITEGQPSKNKGDKRKSPEDYAKQRKASFDAAKEALKKLRSGESGLGVGVPFARELAAIAPHITNIVKSLIDEGIDNFKDIVERIHDELKEHIEGLRKRDVMDLIAGDYNKKSDKTTNPDTDKLIDIKKQAILTKKLQDLQNDLPEDFDKDKKEQSPEVKKLLEQIAKVRKDLDEYKGNPEKRRIAGLEKKLEDLKNGTEKEPTPEREKSEKEKQLLEQIEQEKLSQSLNKIQKQFDGKKDNKFTPDEAKAIWDYGRKQYLDKGIGFNEMIKKVALDTGLSFKQVSEAITSPKIKPISDEMWAKQAAVRRSNIKVKDYIESHNKDNPISKFFKAVSKFPKAVTTAFHGHIFAGTHYPMGFVTPSQWGIYFNGIGKAWRNAYGSEGFHEKEVQALTSDPNYTLAKRAGLQNDVDNTNIDEFEKGGKIFGALGRTGAKGFLGMKWTRQSMFNDYWGNLPEEQKTNESAKVVASLVNLATGASNLKIPDALQEGMFAAGMESARWGRLFQNPAKAIEKSTNILSDIVKGNPVKPEDKVFLKVWGSRVGQQMATLLGVLGANAYVQSKINPKNPVNLTDPTKTDWLKLKGDNTDIDLSGGTLGVKSFLSSIGTYALNDQNHSKEVSDIGGKSIQYARGKLSPLYGDIADIGFGTDLTGNPLPFSNKTPASYAHKLSWPEYIFQKSPIFIAEAVKNMYDNAQDNGIPKSHVDKIVNGVMQSLITTGTGVRTTDSYQNQNKHPDIKPFTIYNPSNATKRLSTPDEIDKFARLKQSFLDDEVKQVKSEGVGFDMYGDVTTNEDNIVKTKKYDELNDKELKQLNKIYSTKASKEAKSQLFGEGATSGE